MKFKRISAVLLAFVMCLGTFSTTAFAYVDENAAKEPAIEEPAPETEPAPEPAESMKPLTPDGNLTLVDDEGKPSSVGKQFITVVTKNGNYFYIIIDRDDKGEQTVHFLNQVDEADLLKLMDEKEAAEHTKPEETPALEPEINEPAPEAEKPVPEEKPKVNVLPAVMALLVLMGGGGFFAFKKLQEKKKEKEAAKPDPDADYVDGEEDYGYSEEFEDEDSEFSDEEDHEPV